MEGKGKVDLQERCGVLEYAVGKVNALEIVVERDFLDHLGTTRAAGLDLCWFGIAAAVPTVLWVAYFGAAAGFDVMAQRLLFDGPAVARSYAIPFPPAQGLATGIVTLVLVAIGLRSLIQKGVIGSAQGTRVFGLACSILVFVGVLWTARLPWHSLT